MYLIGAGGHAASLLDSLGTQEIEAVVLVNEAAAAAYRSESLGGGGLGLGSDVAVLTDAELLELEPSTITLVNGIGQLTCEGPRTRVAQRFAERGFSFVQVVHPQAIISSRAQLGPGVQVLAGAIVGSRATVGGSTIVNTGTVVEHDVSIGVNCHIASGAVVCGGVSIASNTVVGAGATIIQDCAVGSGAIVGAGSVVVRDVAPGVVVSGVPASPHPDRAPSA